MLDIYILTGMSGAGKTFANKCLEDAGFYCVDNLPPELIPHFVELCSNSTRDIDKISLVIDIRGGEFFDPLFKSLDTLDKTNHRYSIVFLDADDEMIVRRYKETRRQHPLAGKNGGILHGISQERELLKRLKDRADFYIDTSGMNTWELKKAISATLMGDENARAMDITIFSFGFKYGLPMDADTVFDVRFLPNPYYEDTLKKLSGENEEVYEFVLANPASQEFIKKASDLLLFIIPHAIAEGKTNLVVAFGCTGGHHRSVVMAIEFCRILTQNGYNVSVRHRDLSAE